MDINFVIMGLFFTSAPSRPSVFHPPPLPTPASSVTHTRSEVEFVHCVHCVHFSPLLNVEPVFPVTRLLPLHRNFWAVGARETMISDKVKKFFLFVSFMCRFSHIYNVSVVLTFVCVISYIYNVPIFLLFMDSFCSFFVHVRLRSFRSMTSFFCSCPAPVFRIYDPPLYILTIPVLFHIILCCFRSNFGSSVLCPVQR